MHGVRAGLRLRREKPEGGTDFAGFERRINETDRSRFLLEFYVPLAFMLSLCAATLRVSDSGDSSVMRINGIW